MMKKTRLASLMAVHFAAFSATAAAAGGIYERRDAPDMGKLAETIEKINKAFEEYKSTNDARLKALSEGKGTADYEAKLAKMDKEIEGLSEIKSTLERIQTKLARPGAGAGGGEGGPAAPQVEAYKSAFMGWIRNPDDIDRRHAVQRAAKELKKYQAALGAGSGDDDDGEWIERKAAQTAATTGAAGGFALPEVIESKIARLARDISPIRQIALVRTVGSSDYKELFDVNGAAFEWVGETDVRNQTDTSDLAEIAPTFGMGSAKPQATEESLDDLFFDVEGWLVDSAAEAISQGEGAAFVAGNGLKKPTGFLAGPAPLATADAARAFGTLQYIASGQAAALPADFNAFYDMVYAVRARYRNNARWVTSKLLLAALRKYKDTSGQYLWQPSVSAGQPATFLGYGITEAEDMPAVAANAFPLAFGDFKEGYLIADRVGMRITRDEITQPGFVKFYVRRRVGGKIRNSEAIKLMKIAAA